MLPGAQWAPNEAWLEEGQNGKKPSEPVDLSSTFCDCAPRDPRPVTLTLFIKAALTGQHFNVVGKMEKAVREWGKRMLKVEGCGICGDEIEIDLRLFRTDTSIPQPVEEDEVDNLALVG